MSDFPKPYEEYASKHILSPEELKTAIQNSSKFLGAHDRKEMIFYFDQDPWIGRQIAYYMQLLDEEKWDLAEMIGKELASEWRAHKKLKGYKDLSLSNITSKAPAQLLKRKNSIK